MAPKPRPYRDFLTPALHRQFTRAAGLTFALCYVEAIWMGEFDFFWSWFPLGPAGARTLMLAISALLIMFVRVQRLKGMVLST
jgi:nucleoporin NDC1